MKSKLLALLFLTAAASGQARHARFLAVGDAPPFRQEIRDGVRYEVDPPDGVIPPREIVVAGAEVKLTLDRMSGEAEVPAGEIPLDLKKKGAADDAAPWLRIAPPESGDFVALLWRDAKSKSWDIARALAIPDNAAAGEARIVNVSPFAARVVVGTEKLVLGAGKSLTRKVPDGAALPFQVLLEDKSGQLRRMFSTELTGGTGERTLAIIYRADGISPRRPVKVIVRRETAPVPPDKKR